MNRIKAKIVMALASLAFIFGFTFSPIVVLAEDQTTEQTSEIIAETSDSVTADEIPTEEENAENAQENSTILESGTNTFENFLAWTATEAEKYGYGDEYRLAFDDIKNAATTKQVTISTLSSLGSILGIVAYIIYKKIADKKQLIKLNELANNFKSQLKKTNELVDATNATAKEEKEVKKLTAELIAETEKTKQALECFVNGFMHFANAVKLETAKKEEIQRDCINALKKIDGEVIADENNQK